MKNDTFGNTTACKRLVEELEILSDRRVSAKVSSFIKLAYSCKNVLSSVEDHKVKVLLYKAVKKELTERVNKFDGAVKTFTNNVVQMILKPIVIAAQEKHIKIKAARQREQSKIKKQD